MSGFKVTMKENKMLLENQVYASPRAYAEVIKLLDRYEGLIDKVESAKNLIKWYAGGNTGAEVAQKWLKEDEKWNLQNVKN